ncbi:hypothetical protein P0Y35_12115 [Kiritimatiellaeota bacterium B1221]|nr:hypothetical protein [Kiritimatiellaeota bacterium B1221]
MAMFRLIFPGLLAGTLSVAQPPPPEMLKVEIQELQTVVETLRAENRVLEKRNQQLMTDVLNLGHQIRALQAQLAEQAPPPNPEPGIEEPRGATVALKSDLHPVISVNVNYHYLIVKAGSETGIQIGEGGSVMRDGEIIASVKVTDVKPRQCVVQIDLNSLSQDGVYPRSEDKVRFP